MEGSGRAYDVLIDQIAADFPDVAHQIRGEVGRGTREENPEGLPDFAMYSKPSATRVSEVAPRKYSDDERLEILLNALLALAKTTSESSRAIIELLNPTTGQPGDNQRITFVDPVTDSDTLSTAVADLDRTPQLSNVVTALNAAVDSVRQRG